MKINITEIKFTIKSVEDQKYPDLLAYVSMTFFDDKRRHFTENGFNLRKSKFDGGKPYLTAPSKKSSRGYYKFNLVEKTLWKEIEREVIEQYEYETIPIVNKDKDKEPTIEAF